ncbi:MAG: alpha/beta hydrolase [Alphaproteobacteria bacterium]|nr:alpha/beta hydrolase [Alphaproteobacteria bacterium]
MFEGFEAGVTRVGDVEIFRRIGGEGPPLLLLHGYPQTHLMWHKVAPSLAQRFTVICPDLRGYGASSKPEPDPENLLYSKRAMAADMVGLMAALGFETFAVAGHDRGGRVAYRLALDHPELVTKIATLDIVPTLSNWNRMADMAIGLRTYHWYFLAQAGGLPERMIAADPDAYLEYTVRSWVKDFGAIGDDPMQAYKDAFRAPGAIAAACADYRAGATTDVEHDRADFGTRKIAAPLLALWGGKGLATDKGGQIEIWQQWADDVRGRQIPCGHFLAEEAPLETIDALLDFF